MSDHAILTVEQGHRSYAKGCRCRYCTKAQSAWMLEYRRSREAQRTNRPSGAGSDEAGQLSLLAPQLRQSDSVSTSPAILRSTEQPEELRTPTSPKAGLHHRDPRKTQLRGALDVAPTSGTKRAAYLLALVNAEQRGLTDHEAALLVRMPVTSITARRNELMAGGFPWVKDSDRERKGPYGSANCVWLATTRAHTWANQRVSA
jgi:hypothetical protein